MLVTGVRMGGGAVMKMTERFLYLCNDQCGQLGGSARTSNLMGAVADSTEFEATLLDSLDVS